MDKRTEKNGGEEEGLVIGINLVQTTGAGSGYGLISCGIESASGFDVFASFTADPTAR